MFPEVLIWFEHREFKHLAGAVNALRDHDNIMPKVGRVTVRVSQSRCPVRDTQRLHGPEACKSALLELKETTNAVARGAFRVYVQRSFFSLLGLYLSLLYLF